MGTRYDKMATMPRDALSQFVASHDFESWATLTFKGAVSQELATERLQQWIHKLCRSEGLRIGYIAVVEEAKTHSHWHLLMLGRNKHDKNLHQVDMEKWSKEWCRINCNSKISLSNGAKIDSVYETSGVSRYLVKHLIPSAESKSHIFYYDKRLLAKCRTDRELNTSRVIRNQNKKVTIMRRRGGEEYRFIKEHMASFINLFSNHNSERSES